MRYVIQVTAQIKLIKLVKTKGYQKQNKNVISKIILHLTAKKIIKIRL